MRVRLRNLLVGLGMVLAVVANAYSVPAGSSPGMGCGAPQCMSLAQAGPGAGEAGKEAETAKARPTTEQAYSLPPDKLAKAVALNRIRLTLDIVGSLWGLAVLWILLASRGAAGLERWAEVKSGRPAVQGLLFFAALTLITTVAGLPLDLIGHIASRHYGISVQGWGGWWGDQGKGLGLSLVIGVPLLLLFNWMVRVSPRRYWVWAWLMAIPLMLAGTFLAPLVIDPLFNKFEPLEKTHPQLVTRLEQVVAKTGTQIPPERMFLMKASEKSNGINAYVTGLGSSKRFVMWDTTTDRMPDDEILFIFGHESGHYVLHHIAKMLTLSTVGIFLLFWLCARGAERLVERYGARWGVASVGSRAGFVTLLLALSLIGFVIAPLSNGISRHLEHQADVFGQEAIHGLVGDPQRTTVSAFNHLGESWLEDPHPSKLVEFWLYGHPTVQERATFAEHYDPWAGGGRGEFFAK